MELLELKKELLSLFETEMKDFSKAVLNSIESGKDVTFSKYVDIVKGDLETDNLQKVWQYYHADRKEKCQDYTPKSIAKLCSCLTETGGSVCYDLCAGSGALTIQKWAQNKDKIFVCEEIDKNVFPLLLFNMVVRNMSGYAICRDALTSEFFFAYKLEKGKMFSAIEKIDTPPEIKADEIISNPPYNIKWNPPAPLFADSRFQKCDIPPASNANWAFVLTAIDRLSEFGKCAFVLPCGFLSKDNELQLRKWSVQSGFIKKVITLPDGMFESTSIPTCVILFERKSSYVEFFDVRKCAEKEVRLQNGQFGGESHQKRTYKKEVNILSDKLIQTICQKAEEKKLFSAVKSAEEIGKQEYNLIPSRYIQYEAAELTHRPYKDIMDDINRVSRERSAVKVTINETLAKQLGLYDVAELEKKSDALDLSSTFHMLGGEYQSKPFIVLSKNKNELKFESNDKEILSSLFSILMPMWKQHIFYLNQQENIFLAELRDAILPDLMSGKLDLSKQDETNRP